MQGSGSDSARAMKSKGQPGPTGQRQEAGNLPPFPAAKRVKKGQGGQEQPPAPETTPSPDSDQGTAMPPAKAAKKRFGFGKSKKKSAPTAPPSAAGTREQANPGTAASGSEVATSDPPEGANKVWPWLKQTSITDLLLALTCVAIACCTVLLYVHQKSAHPKAEQPGTDPGESQITTLSETTSRQETKVADLEAKVAELEGIRQLQGYANEAIGGGSRSALYQLDGYYKNPEIPALREAAKAEIIRVETYYLTTRRFRGFPDELPSIPEPDPVAMLAKILLDGERQWDVRAEAARRLGRMDKDAQEIGRAHV